MWTITFTLSLNKSTIEDVVIDDNMYIFFSQVI